MSDINTGAEAPVNDAPLASTESTVQEAAIETAAPEAVKPSLESDLQSVWDKLHPKRDDSGKFAARETAAQTETVSPEGEESTTGQPEEKPAGTETPSTQPPNSWPAEAKAKWAAVPPDLQAVIAKRETEAHQAITRAGEQIKALSPVREVIDHYSDTFKRNNLHPADGIARLLTVETMLEQDAESAVKEIAKAYGVDLQRLTGQPSAQPAATAEGTPDAITPVVSTLRTELSETKAQLNKVMSYLTTQQRAQVEDEQAVLARQIAEFAKDKPHFESVEQDILYEIPAVRAREPNLSPAEVLAKAYERATRANPDIFQRIQEDQRKADEDKRRKDAEAKAKDARKSAQVNLRPSTGASSAPRTMDDTLSEIARKAYGT